MEKINIKPPTLLEVVESFKASIKYDKRKKGKNGLQNLFNLLTFDYIDISEEMKFYPDSIDYYIKGITWKDFLEKIKEDLNNSFSLYETLQAEYLLSKEIIIWVDDCGGQFWVSENRYVLLGGHIRISEYLDDSHELTGIANAPDGVSSLGVLWKNKDLNTPYTHSDFEKVFNEIKNNLN